MTKLGFALVAIVALTAMVAPSVYAANDYCVIRNAVGQSGITSGIPAYGWSKVSDQSCFATVDAAQRDVGTGNGPTLTMGVSPYAPRPVAIPKAGVPFLVERMQ
ncbi:MAG: hypothetical protein ACLP5H_30545 [Desulfomonilaceae bacterium]